MKKVHLLCGKLGEDSADYWILGVYSSKKKALDACRRLDVDSPGIFHFTFEETVW